MTAAAEQAKKTLLSWSTGKDSAWALHLLRQDPETAIVGLFTTVNEAFQRVAMHATRVDLLRLQARSVSLPVRIIPIPYPCTDEQYAAIMGSFTTQCAAEGIERMAFGDIFLRDVRDYREQQLRGTGIEPVFPLWGMPTADLAAAMLSAGIGAYVSCLDPKKVPPEFAGRRWSESLLEALPQGVDPCGENGEFHTVVVGGPMFREAITVEVGERVERDGFVFADVVPLTPAAPSARPGDVRA